MTGSGRKKKWVNQSNPSFSSGHEFNNVLPSEENIVNANMSINPVHPNIYLKVGPNSDTSIPESSLNVIYGDDSADNSEELVNNDRQTTALEFKSTIGEVRPLLRQWIKSFATPTYDDVETVANFFKSKIKENNLELVYLGLKSLCRNCLSSEHPENWSGAYNGIIREVQRTMLKLYGKRLSVKFEF